MEEQLFIKEVNRSVVLYNTYFEYSFNSYNYLDLFNCVVGFREIADHIEKDEIPLTLNSIDENSSNELQIFYDHKNHLTFEQSHNNIKFIYRIPITDETCTILRTFAYTVLNIFIEDYYNDERIISQLKEKVKLFNNNLFTLDEISVILYNVNLRCK